ncbi:T9SS type A sorting domain-containing protein [Labilibacter marinus]|uniref:T9SS type A sorting domain-containing protein n=1 Tax=Labilibacter marinus TaxID=1477105 RepID=UPI00094F8A3A|nr:FG-GAP-like repeat-containing protein [Labilibacter marinus]
MKLQYKIVAILLFAIPILNTAQNIYSEDNSIKLPAKDYNHVDWIDMLGDGFPDLICQIRYPYKIVTIPNVKGELRYDEADTVEIKTDKYYHSVNWNHDNIPDLILQEKVLLGNEDSSWIDQPLPTSLEDIYWNGLIADFDNDFYIESIGVIKNAYPSIYQYWNDLNQEPTEFSTNIALTHYFKIVDLNEDGRLDIFGPSIEGNVNCYYNLPEGFTRVETSIPYKYKSLYEFADFNGDGKMDVVIHPEENEHTVEVWVKDNDDWKLHFSLPLVRNSKVAVGDIDNNGLADIILSGQFIYSERNATAIYLNNGTGFDRKLDGLPDFNFGEKRLAFTDFNNDGNLDLYVEANDFNWIFLNNLDPVAVPQPIQNFTINHIGEKEIEVSWDLDEPSHAYTYNLSLKQGDKFLKAPFTTSSGKLMSHSNGNMGFVRKANFTLPKDTVFDITVQRVDAANRASTPVTPTQFVPIGTLVYDDIFNENEPKNSTLGTIISGSAEEDTYTYTIITGEGDAHNELFYLDGNILKSNEPIDYEETPICTVRIKIESDGEIITEKKLIIEIGDLPESPSDIILNAYSIFIDEPAGMDVLKIWAGDMDKDEEHTWTILNSTEGDASYFTIEDGYLYLKKELDENERDYSFTVRVVDEKGHAFEKQLTVNGVLDNIPLKQNLGYMSDEYKDKPSSVDAFGNIVAVGYHYSEEYSDDSPGKVSIFRKGADGWKKLQDLFPEDDNYYRDAYGYDVSLSLNYLAVGTGSNHIYIYKREHDAFNHITTIKSNRSWGDFGEKIAITDEYLMVGSTDDNKAYRYKNMGNGDWSLVSSLQADNLPERADFGYVVDVYGKYGLVGAYSNAAETYNGRTSAHIFDLTGNGEAIDIPYPEGITDLEGSFGTDVAITRSYVGVAARSIELNFKENVGAVYLYPYGEKFDFKDCTMLYVPDTIEKRTANSFELTRNSCAVLGQDYVKIYMEQDGHWDFVKKVEWGYNGLASSDKILCLTRKFFGVINEEGLTIHSCNSIGYVHEEKAPHLLYHDGNSIMEEVYKGEKVSVLKGLDYNMGSTLSYSLVSGDGDDHNDLFYLDGDTLKLEKKIDYEKNRECYVRIRVEDETGLSLDKEMTINVINRADDIGEYNWINKLDDYIVDFDLSDEYAVALLGQYRVEKLVWFRKTKYSWREGGVLDIPEGYWRNIKIDQNRILCGDSERNFLMFEINDYNCVFKSQFSIAGFNQIDNFDFKNSKLLVSSPHEASYAGKAKLLKYENAAFAPIDSIQGDERESLGDKCLLLNDGIVLSNQLRSIKIWALEEDKLSYIDEVNENNSSYSNVILSTFENSLAYFDTYKRELGICSLKNNTITVDSTHDLLNQSWISGGYGYNSVPLTLNMSELYMTIGSPYYNGDSSNEGTVGIFSQTEGEMIFDNTYQPSDIASNCYYGQKHKLSANSIMSVAGINGKQSIYLYILPHAQDTSVESDIKEETLKCTVAPNPVQNEINIFIDDEKIGEVSISILSVSGSVLAKEQISKTLSSIKHKINISAFPKGIYLLQVQIDDKLSVKKVYKQ